MVRAIGCQRRNMKTNIINGSERSKLSVAIHYATKEYFQDFYILIA